MLDYLKMIAMLKSLVLFLFFIFYFQKWSRPDQNPLGRRNTALLVNATGYVIKLAIQSSSASTTTLYIYYIYMRFDY